MNIGLMCLAVANLIILILLLKTMGDVHKMEGMLNATSMIIYARLRKEGKTTGDILKDIIEVAHELEKTEGAL